MYVSSEFIHEAALAYHRDVNAFWALHVLSQMAFIWRFDQTKHFHAQDGDRFNHTNLSDKLSVMKMDHMIMITSYTSTLYICYSLIILYHLMDSCSTIILRHNILIDFSNGSNPKYGALAQRWSLSHLSNADAEENS